MEEFQQVSAKELVLGEAVGSLSSVTSKHRTDGQSMRRVRGNLHIELGGFGVFSSGDSKASSYMVIFFLGKESSRGPFNWPLLSWIPSLYHSGCVLGTSTVYLKMWLPGVNSYCSELPRAPGLACIFVCVYSIVLISFGEGGEGEGGLATALRALSCFLIISPVNNFGEQTLGESTA